MADECERPTISMNLMLGDSRAVLRIKSAFGEGVVSENGKNSTLRRATAFT
jgi:hypothetical protein